MDEAIQTALQLNPTKIALNESKVECIKLNHTA